MNKIHQVRRVTTYIIGQGASKRSGPTQHLIAGQSNECHPAQFYTRGLSAFLQHGRHYIRVSTTGTTICYRVLLDAPVMVAACDWSEFMKRCSDLRWRGFIPQFINKRHDLQAVLVIDK